VAELGWDLGLRFQAISAMSISLPEQVGLGFQAISAMSISLPEQGRPD